MRDLQRINALSEIYDRLLQNIRADSQRHSSLLQDDEGRRERATIALGLLQEYSQLYRHYDVQRSAYVTALLAIAGAIGFTDREFTFSEISVSEAIYSIELPCNCAVAPTIDVTGLAFATIGLVGVLATKKSRSRMKLFYGRSKAMRKILSDLFLELGITKVESDIKTIVEKNGILTPSLTKKISRGFAWDFIPLLLLLLGGFLLNWCLPGWGLMFFFIIWLSLEENQIDKDLDRYGKDAANADERRINRSPRKEKQT